MRDIAEVPTQYRLWLARLLESGAVGWAESSAASYINYLLLSDLLSAVIKFAGGNPKRPKSYDQLFPLQALMMRKGLTAGEYSMRRWVQETRENADRSAH